MSTSRRTARGIVLALAAMCVHAAWATDPDPAPDLQWAKAQGTPMHDSAAGVVALADGNSVHAGFLTNYEGSVDVVLGDGEPNETTLQSPCAMLACHAPDGHLVWARAIDGSAVIQSIAAVPTGGFIVCGHAADDVTFGPGEPGETTMPVDPIYGGSGWTGFIAAYEADGSFVGLQTVVMSSSGDILFLRRVSTFADGAFVVAGEFRGDVTFGAEPGNVQTIEHDTYSTAAFVAKYDADGELSWVRTAGDADTLNAQGVTVGGVTALSDGSVVVAGSFDGPDSIYYPPENQLPAGVITFAAGTEQETTLTSTGDNDFYVARYLADGTLAWAKRAGGPSYDFLTTMTCRPDDSVVIGGSSWSPIAEGPERAMSTITFALGESNEQTIDGSGFVACYAIDGELLWARAFETHGEVGGTDVTALGAFPDGSCLVGGLVNGTVVFGPGEANETTYEIGTSNDPFVAHYGADGNLIRVMHASVPNHGGVSPYGMAFTTGIATFANGSFAVTGSFSGDMTIGLGESNETVLHSTIGPTGRNEDGDVADAPGFDIFVASFKAFAPNEAPAGPGAPDVGVVATMPGGAVRTVEVSFSTIDTGGVVSVTTSDSGQALPSGWKLGGEVVWYDVSTTATFTGSVELCFSWNEGEFENEDHIALLHYVDGQWVDVTTSLDTAANVVRGTVTSLSPFALVEVSYVFGGIQSPVRADGSSVFKLGSVVPLKFGLTGPDDVEVTDAVARLRLCKVTSSVTGSVEESEVNGAGQANSGDLFRYDSTGGRYVFNLSTQGLTQGTYQAHIELDDGSEHVASFSLRTK